MMKQWFIPSLLIVFSVLSISSCKTSSIEEKPYVILISLDGFRWDYIERFKPPHLSNFIKNGVQATSLIPSFPSKTFPNHYTIATGMYPDKHGIVGNRFYSYEKKATYAIGNREVVEDGSFYGGSPIWVHAEKSKMISASYFFVGSEADIQGITPTYYKKYDGRIKNNVRINTAIEWLKLPPKERPQLITMYFSDMDDAGHAYGPNNDEELKKVLFALDENLGVLFKGVKETGLPVNIIFVSDHGMTEVTSNQYISIETVKNDALFLTIDNGAIINIYPKDTIQTDAIVQSLKTKERHFKVYKTKNTPGFEYTPSNKNWGAIQILPDFGYYFTSQKRVDELDKLPIKAYGAHGFDPKYKDMHGILYANGPAFKKGYTFNSVKNIHIYPLLCKLLGLEIPTDIDGKLSQVDSVLRKE
ncbi:MAG: alkaline phosphatase family protein [Flavobacteriaceae bacterium]|nr:alkaline phosphatase family protein [Flavobacteriaceae bacterium]